MGYITESRLSNLIDVPVALPATEIKQGDWLVVATVKIAAPQRLRYRFLNFQLHSASVSIVDIAASNKILGNLGYAYVALRRDYQSGSPGVAGALEILSISQIGLVSRAGAETIFATAGSYSWLVANNMQPSDSSTVPSSTEINFVLSATGQVRLELDSTV